MAETAQHERSDPSPMYQVEERLNQHWMPIEDGKHRTRFKALTQARYSAAEAHRAYRVVDLDLRSVTDIVEIDSVQPSARQRSNNGRKRGGQRPTSQSTPLPFNK